MFEDTVQPTPGFVTVAEAAGRLGVSQQRVRRLIEAQELRARDVRGIWLVSLEDVEHRQMLTPTRGRRFTPARAWGVLYLADGLPAPWLDRVARYKLRSLLAARGLRALQWGLSTRGRRTPLRTHPSELSRLLAEPDLMLTGPPAATDLQLGLSASDVVDAYLSTDRFERLVNGYRLRASREPNVILRLTPRFAQDWPERRYAPVPAIALDLAEDPDPRTREVGLALLARFG